MDPALHEALLRAAAAEAANAVLTAQVGHLQQQLQHSHQQLQDARNDSRGHVDFMRQFMVAMASTFIQRMGNAQASNKNQTVGISDAINNHHEVNGSKPIRAALQPHVMFAKKRLDDGINTDIKCTRGQERYVKKVRKEIIEDGYTVIAKVPVGNAINMGQHVATQGNLQLAPGVRFAQRTLARFTNNLLLQKRKRSTVSNSLPEASSIPTASKKTKTLMDFLSAPPILSGKYQPTSDQITSYKTSTMPLERSSSSCINYNNKRYKSTNPQVSNTHSTIR
jgi:hypothetical protein